MTPGSSAVQVLLATYNGARFLHEQIDSILAQTHGDLTILARDDGSKDETPKILVDYARRYPGRFAVLQTGAPSGSARDNFARLIAASTAPYLACADQDDVWLPDKIAASFAAMRALEQTHAGSAPLLVFTDLRVVDDALRELHPSFWAHQHIDPRNIHHLSRLLMQNVVTGCTMLFNQPLAELTIPMPADAYMHDWWMALIASTLGAVTWLTQPTVLYRQHGSNVLGAAEHGRVTGIPKWRQHAKRRAQWEVSERQTAALLECFGSRLQLGQVRMLKAFARCGAAPSRFVRASNFIRNRFFLTNRRATLAMLWYLWDMEAAKRND